jgi:hypothetical protein
LWGALVGTALSCGARSEPAARLPTRPVVAVEPPVLEVVPIHEQSVMECDRHDLAVRLRASGRVMAEQVLDGECAGACTEEAKAEGERTVDRIKQLIESGAASDSELDYNFTECVFHGADLARFEGVNGRRFALIVGYDAGPHDVPSRWFRLATELCGKTFVGQPFGKTYANRWEAKDLTLVAAPDGVVVKAVDGSPTEVYRVSFPAGCKRPLEQAAELE